MMKCYAHLYVNESGQPDAFPDMDAAEDFQTHLTASHRKFFDSLSAPEKEIVEMSLDPFETLRLLRSAHKLYRKGQV